MFCCYRVYHINMGDIRKLLGLRIKELRKQRGLTQEVLAEIAGIETASLSNIEIGNRYPTPENLDSLAKALNVLPCELFTFEHLNMPPVENAIAEITAAINADKELAQKMYIVYKNLTA